MLFCNDVDLLAWEPGLIKDASFLSQTLASGSGNLGAGQFEVITGPNLNVQHVQARNVLTLSGSLAGCYAITALLGASFMQISVLYADLFPDSGAPADPVGGGNVDGVDFTVRTFWPQRKVISDFLLAAVGVTADTATSIINPTALRRTCALGALQMIYSATAAAASEPARYNIRADLYERLYRRALRQTMVDIDLNGDGEADTRRSPGLLRLCRE